MKYFLDTEFIEDGSTIDLISIGIVCEDGREFYALNFDCDFSKANDWVKHNVLIHLPARNNRRNLASSAADMFGKYASKARIKCEILDFIKESEYPHCGLTYEEKLCVYLSPKKKPEFWGYYADYDWVAFCQLFGTMMDLPKGFPKYCRDLKQLADMVAPNVRLDKVCPQQNEHNALDDARWNKQVFDFLDRPISDVDD